MKDPRIDRLYTATRRMQQGEFAVDIERGAADDIGLLGSALSDLAQSLDQRFAQFQTLTQVTEQINAGLMLEEVLNSVFVSFRTVIPYDRIGFALLEDKGAVVRSHWARSDAPHIRIGKGFAAKLKGSSLEQIIETGRPRILNDLPGYLEQHPASAATALIVEEGMRSSLTCPLVAMGKQIGFLFFSSMQRDTYRDLHVDVFMQIAGQLAVIVEKSRLYQQLIELNAVKDRFLGIAAHDLRNPIAAVQGYVELLASGELGDLSDKQRFVLRNVDRYCQMMLALVNDLLDINAIESGMLALKMQQVDLRACLSSCHETYALLAQPKNIRLLLEMPDDLPALRMDPQRMEQVFGNLVNNAIKYSHPGTTTIFRVEVSDSEVQFSVADQGQGIPGEDLPKIFRDFGRANVRPTGGEKSIGLGLAICRRIVEAHGGRIWCETEFGKGSTFFVALPR